VIDADQTKKKDEDEKRETQEEPGNSPSKEKNGAGQSVLQRNQNLPIRNEFAHSGHCFWAERSDCRLPERLAVSYQKVGRKYYIHKKTLMEAHKLRYIQKSRLSFPFK
jgi:hypothetical protein